MTEDEERVCGYAVAALDAKDLASKTDESWVPFMQNKYPKPAKEELSPAEVSVFPLVAALKKIYIKKDSVEPCFFFFLLLLLLLLLLLFLCT